MLGRHGGKPMESCLFPFSPGSGPFKAPIYLQQHFVCWNEQQQQLLSASSAVSSGRQVLHQQKIRAMCSANVNAQKREGLLRPPPRLRNDLLSIQTQGVSPR